MNKQEKTISRKILKRRAELQKLNNWDFWNPPENIKVTEYLKRHVKVPREVSGARAGSLTLEPWWHFIIDEAGRADIREVTIMSAAQTGKTFTAILLCLYFLFNADAPVFIIASDEKLSRTILDERLKKIAEHSPEFAKKIRLRNGRDSRDRLYGETADIKCGTANSASSLSSIAAQVILADECALYANSIAGNSDAISLVKNRLKSYAGISKAFFTSTPLEKGDLFDKQFNKGVVHRWYLPCPNCSADSFVDFGRLKYPHDATPRQIQLAPELIKYECEHCGHQLSEREYSREVRKGRWVADKEQENKSPSAISFAVRGLLSSTVTWAEQVCELLEAGSDPIKLQGFHNNTQGIPWEDKRESIKEKELIGLISQSYNVGEVPLNTLSLIIGIDVGGTPGKAGGLVPDEDGKCLKFQTTTLAILPGGRVHAVECNTFATWDDLWDKYVLSRTFLCPDNQALYRIRYAFIDSGGSGSKGASTTQVVYSLAQSNGGLQPCKGVPQYQHPFKLVSLEKTKAFYGRTQELEKPITVLHHNPDYFKSYLWQSVKAQTFSLAGGLHKDYTKHLTSEVRVTIKRRNQAIETYVPKYEGIANHWLDSTLLGIIGAMQSGLFQFLSWGHYLETCGEPWEDIAGEERPEIPKIPPPPIPPPRFNSGDLY